ncbi:MAG: HAD family phosphatase [Saprospiraceae bacterium]
MKQKIKNIVFDFGGVLLNIEPDRTIESMQQITGLDWKTITQRPNTTLEILHRFEKGEISVETFINHIQRKSVFQLDPRQIIDAWNAMLIGWNPTTFDRLKALKEDYNLYLLSNINSLHLEWIHKNLKKIHRIVDFENTFFDHVFYSHKIGFRKPNSDIYHYVQDMTQIKSDETLFIDDLPENINAAKSSVGWHCLLHNPDQNVFDTLSAELLTPEKC